MIVDLAAAAERLRRAAASLGITSLLGWFVRAWIVVWVLGLLFGLLMPPLMSLAILGLGFIVISIGAWTLWRTVTSWFWFGMWRMWR
jgi:hypothetical protein